MTREEILKLRKGDVVMDVLRKDIFVVESIEGTPDKGCVRWRDGGSIPTYPHLQSPEWVSLMKERVVYCQDVGQAIYGDVKSIMNALLELAPDKKITITKDWWKIEYLDKDE